ncbi:cutinase family protein [Mycolicibacterium tusciae]|uniref:cutinase family protein n=1 Tax=Mycolicibacterium tusciae TaxID=75922 RepID=UPI00024A1F69|nr:cutinase family protein [Mycolicibacterium tusciae]
MGAFRIVGVVSAVAALSALLQSAALAAAHAAPCPDAEVIFARGTTELPGVGPTGDAFVNSLRSQVGAKSVEVYPVNYPATTDFRTAVDGINDARARILATAASCPDTKMVLGGFSQGAAVMGFVTADAVPDGVSASTVPAPMPLDVADKVAAVALFGKPSARFMRAINDPQIVIGPNYVDKTIDLCVDDDLVCDPDGRSFGVHSRYPEVGMANEGATLAAQKLQASWAADAATDAPASPAPAPAQPPAPALLSVPVTGETRPSHGGGPAPRSPGPAQAAPVLPGPAPIAP